MYNQLILKEWRDFEKFPGPWQIRQIEGADKAFSFGRSTISCYTKNNYSEEIVQAPYWGTVTRQLFISP